MTVLTLGLWGLSWIALTIGHHFWPWRCKHCGCTTPISDEKSGRSRSSVLAQPPTSQAPHKE